jgi:hypothetical protein
MHSALFVAVEPENPPQGWFEFVDNANKNEIISRHAERLARNVWLVKFQSSPAALSFLIAHAETRALSYTILPLADAPQWIRSDPNTDRSP